VPKEITLTIVRHGRSEGQVKRILGGHMDFDLSDLGQEQARLTGVALEGETFDYACASDLKRAFKTMEGILAQNQSFKGQLHSSKLLRETFFGSFEGWTYEAMKEYRDDVHAKGWETDGEIEARIETFMKELLKHTVAESPGVSNILLVSHCGWIKTFVSWLERTYPIDGLTKEMMTDTADYDSKRRAPNASISKFRLKIDDSTDGCTNIVSGHCLQFYDNAHLLQRK